MNLIQDRFQIQLYGEVSDANEKTLVLTIEEHGEGHEVYDECLKAGCSDFILAGISGIVWEDDLSPWQAPGTFKKAPPFGGKADAFLHAITEQLLPAVIEKLGETPKQIIFAGYSLAGLFATYSSFQTDAFSGIVSASGSMWYPQFMDYAKGHKVSSCIKVAYFSVGDKEANTKNAVMKPVEDNTRAMEQLFAAQGIHTTFELNEGGHFVDDAKRLAKGIAWVLKK